MNQKVKSYAAHSATAPLALFEIERREPGPHDVQIEILYCGVCHSDLHTIKNEWKNALYPVVPGHEIVGKVTKVGEAVTNFAVGDLAAVGCLVDSCRECKNCQEDLEQYCEKGFTGTYNSVARADGKYTYGGYSTHLVVDEKFMLSIPKQFKEGDLARIAPLLCAGITTYSPLRHWKVSKGQKVGIVGLGGLGHIGLKIARALGAHVVLFTTSPNKAREAKVLGAHEVVISTQAEELKNHLTTFDFILDTVSASHTLDIYLELLKTNGTLCLLGAPEMPHPSPSAMTLIFQRRTLAGSLIGGIKETQEMLNFCAEHHILADIELISMGHINEAYQRLVKGDVKYRFVIDLASLKD